MEAGAKEVARDRDYVVAHTEKDYEVLMVVMRAKQLPAARDIVRDVDNKAFMIVTNATSVFGQGFKRYDTEEV